MIEKMAGTPKDGLMSNDRVTNSFAPPSGPVSTISYT